MNLLSEKQLPSYIFVVVDGLDFLPGLYAKSHFEIDVFNVIDQSRKKNICSSDFHDVMRTAEPKMMN
jgi:hypothetical protein